jgi:glutamate-5-semialdehyde dehydrogenase
MRDRLVLNKKRIGEMAQGLPALKKLSDPLHQILSKGVRPNGLRIEKVSVPLGVVAVIYESRPNVTVDLAGLALKSGNGLVLKGGSEAFLTNRVLVALIHRAMQQSGLPASLVYLIHPKENWQTTLLAAHQLVDVIIPRGGTGLINWVRQHSKVPVIETGAGVCHILVDSEANINQAVKIIVNAKTQRPDVCNALDTLVVHQAALKKLLPPLAPALAKFGVEVFADAAAYQLMRNLYPADWLKKAQPEHFGKEFLSLKLSIKTVKNFEAGLEFVKKYTSGHSEALLSHSGKHIRRFLKEVDAAAVFSNASTRFTDGGEFGMGVEVGVSTQKLHARGPMGLEALTSYKWVVLGNGQTRA